jgi:hypothetical protein
MNIISSIPMRSCDALVDALQAEFGATLADRILEAEAADFLWDARVTERYLGQHDELGFDDEAASQEFSRLVILSDLAGHWHVGMCLVDGEGCAVELLWKKQFDSHGEAEAAFARAH